MLIISTLMMDLAIRYVCKSVGWWVGGNSKAPGHPTLYTLPYQPFPILLMRIHIRMHACLIAYVHVMSSVLT